MSPQLETSMIPRFSALGTPAETGCIFAPLLSKIIECGLSPDSKQRLSSALVGVSALATPVDTQRTSKGPRPVLKQLSLFKEA